MDIDSMRQAATQAGALLRALGNEDRLLLLCQLSQGEMSVGNCHRRWRSASRRFRNSLGYCVRKGWYQRGATVNKSTMPFAIGRR